MQKLAFISKQDGYFPNRPDFLLSSSGQDEMASGCARGVLGWILGKISSQNGLWGIGSGCPGMWLSHCPCRYSKDVSLAPHLGTWRSARLTVGLDDLTCFFQPKGFCDSMIQLFGVWVCDIQIKLLQKWSPVQQFGMKQLSVLYYVIFSSAQPRLQTAEHSLREENHSKLANCFQRLVQT